MPVSGTMMFVTGQDFPIGVHLLPGATSILSIVAPAVETQLSTLHVPKY